jgi:putative transposase
MYIDNSGQWVYICLLIIDLFTREIVGHHEGLRGRTKEVRKVLDEVVEKRNTDELVLRTDNGFRFRSREF